MSFWNTIGVEVSGICCMSKNDENKLLKIREAAEFLGVNPETLRRWDNDDILPAIIVSPRGDRRYRKEDLERFLEKNRAKKK